jgi:bifunctional non-homologous end joining protein LigD
MKPKQPTSKSRKPSSPTAEGSTTSSALLSAIGAVRGPLPEAQAPQLCLLVADPPEGAEWVSEIKFDGYRLLAAVQNGNVRLLTRNGHDWADRMPSVSRTIGRLPVQAAMLDGELVAVRDDGVTSFPGLQAGLKAGRDDTLFFYVFDLLHLDGWDLRGCTLLER